MSDKEKYVAFAQHTADLAIFFQPWWLDVVTAGKWDVVLVEKDNKVIGALPFFPQEKKLRFFKLPFKFNGYGMPKLTQYLGPVFKYPLKQKYSSRLSFEKKVMTELLEKLPAVDFFDENFAPSISNWLPAYWKGFRQTTRYTYKIQHDIEGGIDQIFKNFQPNIRSDIRKAEKQVTVRQSNDIEILHRQIQMTFARQGEKMPYTKAFLNKLNEACEKRNCTKMYYAIDEAGRIHAAIYTISDSHTVYYVLSGGDPSLRNSGATSFLQWQAIQDAVESGKNYDFEGSMIEPIEKHFRAFGGKQTPYFRIQKNYSKLYFFIEMMYMFRHGI